MTDVKTSKIKLLAFLGIGIALYFALGCIMNIPVLANSHLQTDLGYIAFAVCLFLFGWSATIVGVVGCLFESLLISGWVPVGWMLGQVAIGLICGIIYKKADKKIIHIIFTVVAVFIGVALIKSIVECALYSIPFVVKFPKNCVAFVADTIPMIIGLPIAYKLKTIIKF